MSVITSVNGDVEYATSIVAGVPTFLNALGGPSKLNEVTKWNWSAKVNVHEYASNYTAGIRRKLRGTKTATGAIHGVYDPIVPIHHQVNEDTDTILRFFFTTAHYIQCPVIIDKLDFDEDIDNGNITGWTLDWGANGIWTYPAALVPLVLRGLQGTIPGSEAMDVSHDVAYKMGVDDEEEIGNIRRVARLVSTMLKGNEHQAQAV